MFKKILPIMLAALALSAVSCKSDDNDDEPTNGGSTWVLVQIDDTKYEYDKSGRIIKAIESDGDTYTVTYGDGTITYNYQGSDNAEEYRKFVYTTNENGVIVSGIDVRFNDKTTYTYDANGYLVKSVTIASKDVNTTETYSWSDGELTERESFYGGSQTLSQYEYDYDSPMNADCVRFINQFYIPIGDHDIVIQGGGFGKVPSVPVKTNRGLIGSDYTHTWSTTTRTFSDFDKNGCPATMTVQYDSGRTTTSNLVWAKR